MMTALSYFSLYYSKTAYSQFHYSVENFNAKVEANGKKEAVITKANKYDILFCA